MSLTSQLASPAFRDRYRPIAPRPELFRVDPLSLSPEVPAFCRTACLVPPDVFGGQAGRVGTAFDYLFRAQLARWAREDPAASMVWIATRGLSWLNVSREEALIVDMDGPVWLGPDCLALAKGPYRDTLVGRIYLGYDAACRTWERFVSGKNVKDDAFIDAVWLLAGLEAAYRATAYPVSAEVVFEPPDAASRNSVRLLWEVLRGRSAMFTGATQRIYNPKFGDASNLVDGADADIVLDDTLIDIKATVRAGYKWTDAAQLASYVVFAAMCGKPWPIRRAGIYQARYGRLLWFDVAELAQATDLQSFARELTAGGAARGGLGRATLCENLARNLALLPAPLPRPPRSEFSQPQSQLGLPQRFDLRSIRHATEMAWALAILRRYPDIDFSVRDLVEWQDEPKAFDAYGIAMALEELGRQGLAVKGPRQGKSVPYWTVPETVASGAP